MEDSECWRAMGCIEAGQSITDVALFFAVHDSVISRLRTTPNHANSCPNVRSRSTIVTNPAEDRYIAILAKRNHRVTFTRVTSMVTIPLVRRYLQLLYAEDYI